VGVGQSPPFPGKPANQPVRFGEHRDQARCPLEWGRKRRRYKG
jgi:hypothetical protein